MFPSSYANHPAPWQQLPCCSTLKPSESGLSHSPSVTIRPIFLPYESTFLLVHDSNEGFPHFPYPMWLSSSPSLDFNSNFSSYHKAGMCLMALIFPLLHFVSLSNDSTKTWAWGKCYLLDAQTLLLTVGFTAAGKHPYTVDMEPFIKSMKENKSNYYQFDFLHSARVFICL